MNVCGPCGLDFGSVKAFDAHRVGTHEYTFEEGLRMNPPRENGRRCLSLQELQGAGFAQNARGAWSLTRDLERTRAGLLREPRSGERHV